MTSRHFIRNAALALMLGVLAPHISLASNGPVPKPKTADATCLLMNAMVAQSFRLTTDHLYRASAHPQGFDVVPVFNSDEIATVKQISCPDTENHTIRVTVELESTGETAYFDVTDWSEVAHFLAPMPAIG